MRPQATARRLYQRRSQQRSLREEQRFHTALRHDPEAPQLLLSPHFDDAVLDRWTLLSSDREVKVVNVFAGVPAPGRLTLWDSITGASDSNERCRERIAEDAEALSRAGRQPVNLPFLDSQYRQHSSPALEDLDRAIGAAVPSLARVHVPAGIGSHPDHILTRRYGLMLKRAGIPVCLYADLPYCLMHGWPTWVDGREPDPHRNVDAFWESFLGPVPDMPPLRSARIELLPEPVRTAKLEALRCYATQFSALEYGARGLFSDPGILGFEVAWDLS